VRERERERERERVRVREGERERGKEREREWEREREREGEREREKVSEREIERERVRERERERERVRERESRCAYLRIVLQGDWKALLRVYECFKLLHLWQKCRKSWREEWQQMKMVGKNEKRVWDGDRDIIEWREKSSRKEWGIEREETKD
jgi:hypothetical protein